MRLNQLKYLKPQVVVAGKLVLGMALVVASIAVLRSDGSPVVNAQNNNSYDYQTTWTATSLLTMQTNSFQSFSTGTKIALGPSAWNVVINDKNGKKVYEENWQTPIGSGNFTANTSSIPTVFNNFDPSKWLFSINFADDLASFPSQFTFKSEPTSGLSLGNIANPKNNRMKVGNGARASGDGTQSLAVHCVDTIWCVYPTGGYGWQLNVNDNTNDNSLGAEGLVMPLQWTVYGKTFN